MDVTKKTVFTTFTLTTVGLTTYLLTNKNRRKRVLDQMKNAWNKVKVSLNDKNKHDPALKTKIGHPHPHDHGDNNMVSEGAMYSVNYYNVQKDKEQK
ncbi:hypothetical protein MK805_16795 [Shimazuella sp. AN120528]|uniref:hypothetical protein n=1 Tax=Shimazuella soli TaxID=1892854 RepID=UPI001F0ECB09|nr:hypothetical protein [Shimazuella soli]MCH5586596.1 hypothetical protein [Shimazuella soli]